MSEEQANYQTEVQEALEMAGAGYDKNQPSVIIQPRKKGIALFDSGLEEYDVWGWVKISANFINHIQKLDGAHLKCWLVIALAIDENGKCKLKIKQLQLLTKLSHTAVINATRDLEEMGYMRVKRHAKGNEYEPIFAARGVGNDPQDSVVNKVDSTPVYQVESTGAIEKSHSSIKELKELSGNSKKQLPEGSDVAFILAVGQDITDEAQQVRMTEHNALVAFEASYNAPPNHLRWYSGKKEWAQLRNTVVDLYKSDPNIFEKIKAWRNVPYQRGVAELKDVRRDPETFISMYAKFSENQPQESAPQTNIDSSGKPETY